MILTKHRQQPTVKASWRVMDIREDIVAYQSRYLRVKEHGVDRFDVHDDGPRMTEPESET